MESYEVYVARCAAEDLTPFSIEAWDIIRRPMTGRSMQGSWKSTLLRGSGWATMYGNHTDHFAEFQRVIHALGRRH